MKHCSMLFMILILTVFAFNTRADVPRSIYAINASAETISKLNIESGHIAQNIAKTGQIPNDIVYWNEKIYIVNSTTSSIQILDPRTDRITGSIALQEGGNPWSIAFTGTQRAYVSNYVANSVSVVDIETQQIIDNIPVGTGPEGILVVGNRAYVANTGGYSGAAPYQGSISVIDITTDSVTHTLPVPDNPQDMALAPDNHIHVPCTGDYVNTGGSVAVINPSGGADYSTPTVTDTIALGGAPAFIEITAEGIAYCLDWGTSEHGFMYSYDTATDSVLHDGESPILTGPNAGHLLYDPIESCLWIVSMTQWGGDGFVQKYDTELDTITRTSGVIGSGTQRIALVDQIYDITPWADQVVEFTPGAGAGFGENYFPTNVLGPPDPDPMLSIYQSSNKPQEILSLGTGGEIVLEFIDTIIVDGEGADFTVFENPFVYSMGGEDHVFIEAGIVSVSQDGNEFVEFPYDTVTWSGLAGVTPTLDAYHFDDPSRSGGDSFDLADVGLESARYVKIRDLGSIKKEGAWNGDFDLDAVVAVNYISTETLIESNPSISAPANFVLHPNTPNPFNPVTQIRFSVNQPGRITVDIYSITGRNVNTLVNRQLSVGKYEFQWDSTDDRGLPVASGVYMARISSSHHSESIKMTLVR
ncbi:MAG: FlgD immunoglobulin-like domain containing protein [candidate division KSB1 bacterium]|nr:FlgD immunoglobulin-like domain containing protein [candidate division KSB1 bacterium]